MAAASTPQPKSSSTPTLSGWPRHAAKCTALLPEPSAAASMAAAFQPWILPCWRMMRALM